MKIHIALVALLLGTSLAFSQTTTREETTTTTSDAGTSTTTTTTTSSGTLHQYTPGSTFVVKETAGPVNYRYGKSVTYVTSSGKTLTEEEVKTRVKVGVPVHVHYINEGENRVVNRVVIED